MLVMEEQNKMSWWKIANIVKSKLIDIVMIIICLESED